jgi:(p)ppGpp synthase/HD superfamily hydrolase
MKNQELTDSQKYKLLYKELITSCGYISERSNRQLLKQAFIEVLRCFGNTKNVQGEFQLTHAVSVTRILADDLGLDTTSLLSALQQQIPV